MTDYVQTLTKAAAGLCGDISGRAELCDELRQPPDETIDAFKSAGFFRIMRPKRWGGFELGPEELRDVVLAACTGCGSTAWFLTLVTYHAWFVALLSGEGQEEIFSTPGDILAPVVFAPNGTATPATGGYRISGRWAFCTGSSHCNWVGMGARQETQGDVKHLMVFMPRKDVTILDTWFSSGLRGTASADIVAEDVFVPRHRVMDFGPLWAGNAEGAVLHESWIYRAPMRGFLSIVGVIPAFAIVRGMIDAFEERAGTRVKLYSGKLHKDDSSTQIRLAQAHTRYDACALLMQHAIEDFRDYALGDDHANLVRRVRYRMDAAYIIETLRQITSDLMLISGASAMAQSSPIQRAHRDMLTIATHHAYVYDAVSEIAGKVRLGIETDIANV